MRRLPSQHPPADLLGGSASNSRSRRTSTSAVWYTSSSSSLPTVSTAKCLLAASRNWGSACNGKAGGTDAGDKRHVGTGRPGCMCKQVSVEGTQLQHGVSPALHVSYCRLHDRLSRATAACASTQHGTSRCRCWAPPNSIKKGRCAAGILAPVDCGRVRCTPRWRAQRAPPGRPPAAAQPRQCTWGGAAGRQRIGAGGLSGVGHPKVKGTIGPGLGRPSRAPKHLASGAAATTERRGGAGGCACCGPMPREAGTMQSSAPAPACHALLAAPPASHDIAGHNDVKWRRQRVAHGCAPRVLLHAKSAACTVAQQRAWAAHGRRNWNRRLQRDATPGMQRRLGTPSPCLSAASRASLHGPPGLHARPAPTVGVAVLAQ